MTVKSKNIIDARTGTARMVETHYRIREHVNSQVGWLWCGGPYEGASAEADAGYAFRQMNRKEGPPLQLVAITMATVLTN